MQRDLRRRVVDLAAVAGDGRDRQNVDDPSSASTDHQQDQRPGDVQECDHGDVDDAVPLLAGHGGKDRVGIDAGIVDQDLDRAGGDEVRQRRRGRFAFGDVENDRFDGAAAGDDLADDSRGLIAVAVDVYDDVSVGGHLLGARIAGRILDWARGEASIIGWLLQTKALTMIIVANCVSSAPTTCPMAKRYALPASWAPVEMGVIGRSIVGHDRLECRPDNPGNPQSRRWNR